MFSLLQEYNSAVVSTLAARLNHLGSFYNPSAQAILQTNGIVISGDGTQVSAFFLSAPNGWVRLQWSRSSALEQCCPTTVVPKTCRTIWCEPAESRTFPQTSATRISQEVGPQVFLELQEVPQVMVVITFGNINLKIVNPIANQPHAEVPGRCLGPFRT